MVTADLMFGHMPAPPPTTGHSDILQVSEMLDLFTEEGLPVDSTTLSPIAVVRKMFYDTVVFRSVVHTCTIYQFKIDVLNGLALHMHEFFVDRPKNHCK